VGLAIFGLICNASYRTTFGALDCHPSCSLDGVLLPRPSHWDFLTFATVLACRGDRHGATIAWCLRGSAIAMVLLNSCGFSSQYIGDDAFAREQITDHATERKAALQQLKAQRASILELHRVGKIDVLMSRAKTGAAYRHTNGYPEITAPKYRAVCETHHGLIVERAESVRRDSLDSQIIALEGEISTAPAIASADPGARLAADMPGCIPRGTPVPTIHEFPTPRIVILTLTPAFAGSRLGLCARHARTGRG
jgi:hypothetical protein